MKESEIFLAKSVSTHFMNTRKTTYYKWYDCFVSSLSPRYQNLSICTDTQGHKTWNYSYRKTIECIGISYANCHYVQDPIIYSIFRINHQKLCVCHTYINDELAIIFIFAASLFSFQPYNIWRWYIISCHVLTGR